LFCGGIALGCKGARAEALQKRGQATALTQSGSPVRERDEAPTEVIRTSKLENIVLIDLSTGTRQEFHSLEQIPPDLLAKLKEAKVAGQHVTKELFSYQGPDGPKHTYHSLEDMPLEVRAFFEDYLRRLDSY
jgi:hypothetical protein